MTAAETLLLLPAGWVVVFLAGASRVLPPRRTANLAILACLAPLAALLAGGGGDAQILWRGAFFWDSFARTLTVATLAATAGVLLLSGRAGIETGLPALPFAVLSLAMAAGAIAAVATTDLATAFIGVEIASLSGYALAGLRRGAPRDTETALKYFLFGACATGFLAYGLALLYAGTGATDVAAAGGAFGKGLVRAGSTLFLVGLAIKAGVAPFHLWVPDVYGGSAAPAAALLSTVSKIAALGVLFRFAGALLPADEAVWTPIFWTLAALTMTLGNLAALKQTDLKRLLAYSSIGHTGYLLMGILAAPLLRKSGGEAVALYLAVYAFMGVATFGFLSLHEGRETPCGSAALAGLSRRRPYVAAVVAVGLISLAGIPPTAGFAAKFSIFADAFEAGFPGLVALAIANTLVALAYYLKGLSWIYFQEPAAGAETEPTGRAAATLVAAALGAGLATVLALGTLLPLLTALRCS